MKKMNTYRKLTYNEEKALVARLVELRSSIETSYAYPLDDLINSLKNPKKSENNEVEEKNGKALKYYLHFSSPIETWHMLCGYGGVYTIDAKSMMALDFYITDIN